MKASWGRLNIHPMPLLPARRPGPRPTVPEVSPTERLLLQRLQRLRVLTSFQAHWLVEPFHAINPGTGRPLTERNTRLRLQRLVEEGFLKESLTQPEKGGFSGHTYRLGGKGLRALGSSADKALLIRPSVDVLRYLLLRNEVYARGRQAGWTVVSPLLFGEQQPPEQLDPLRHWVRVREPLQQEQGRVPGWLTFEGLLRSAPDGSRPSEFVLVVVDDVRRAIVPVRRGALLGDSGGRVASSPPPAQVEELPDLLPGAGLLLRDSQSQWNPTTQGLERISPRLQQWRRVLSRKYGSALLATDTLFPDLWSRRVHSPRSVHSLPLPDGEGEGT